MAQSATHDLLEVVGNIGGFEFSKGLGGGVPVRPSRNRAAVESFTGVKGLGGFAKVLDESGAIDIDVIPTSEVNGVFNRFHWLNMGTAGGVGFEFALTAPHFEIKCPICMFAGEGIPSIGDTPGVLTWTVIGVQWRRDSFGKGPTPTTRFSELPELPDIPTVPVPA